MSDFTVVSCSFTNNDEVAACLSFLRFQGFTTEVKTTDIKSMLVWYNNDIDSRRPVIVSKAGEIIYGFHDLYRFFHDNGLFLC